jgi:ABC-type amino acid transport system permease subunit
MMMPPSPESFARFLLYLDALARTLAIAFLGTLLAAVLAFPLGFLAARNVVSNWVARFTTRRFLDTIRSVDTLIWALIWISAVHAATERPCCGSGSCPTALTEFRRAADRWCCAAVRTGAIGGTRAG